MFTTKVCTQRKPEKKPLTLAVGIAIAVLSVGPFYSIANAAEPTTPRVASEARNFTISAGPLSQVLSQFAGAAGVALSFDAGQLGDVQSSGLKGTYTVEQGFDVLLSGTGQRAVRQRNGDYVLQQAQANMLPPVTVTGDSVSDGSTEMGYVTEKVSQVGPWQGRTLQDTPYSMTVYSEELMENLQATTPDQVFRMNPTTQLVRPQHENNQPRVMMRGFTVQNSYRDGVPDDQYNHTSTTEDAERIEILTGLSGFLYGPNNIGGVVNYITKRSTDERLNNITLSSLGNESWHVHGDFGGKFDSDGRFGYRINLVEQDGDTAIERQEIEKSFYSLALDGELFDGFWVQLHGMKRTYDVNGSQTYWYFGDGVSRPKASAIDNDISWGQPWTNRWYDYTRYGVNLKWDIAENIAIRGAYIDNRGTRGSESTRNTLTSDHTYDQSISGVYSPGVNDLVSKQRDKGGSIYADFGFDTGEISHKLTLGYQFSESWQDRMDGTSAASISLTGLTLDSPTYVSRPNTIAPVNRGVLQNVSHQKTRNVVIGDDVTVNEKWSALLGVAHTSLETLTYIWSPFDEGYDESAVTPSLSLLYKPQEYLTTYISYMEALESGGTAGVEYNGAPVANAGEVFDPLVSEQIEIGAKLSWLDLSLNTALFRIEKGLQYYDLGNPGAPRFVQDGLQVHQGVEFVLLGKLTSDLSVLGGFTWLDAKVEDQRENPELEGKRPTDVAEKLFKIRAEYTVPSMRNLSFSAAALYNGSSYGDTFNTDKVPGYTLFDLGSRYQLDLSGKPITLRLDVLNLFNKHYWNGFNGTRIGDPRTVLLSASVRL